MTDFKELGLSEETLAALESKGFTCPTPIQERTIPLLLQGAVDIVGQAQTGTGKTAAFGLPIIETAVENAKRVQALVLTPTRELAIQVADEINSLKGKKRIRVLPVYGGQAIHMQLKALKSGVDVVVGTPGRIMDHLKRGTLHLDELDFFVLDEADEMCNMGFVDDVREILKSANTDRRTLLFSATMPHEVMRIAKEFMGDYELITVKAEKNDIPLTKQVFHEVADSDRFEALCRVVDAEPDFYGLVFTRTRADADRVASRLTERGYPAEPIHGDLSQARREEILGRFKKRLVTILVATDVAARGIDVPDLTHVVNFALPQDPQTFVHRTGRTGRAGKEGVAISLIAPSEFRRLMFITKSSGIDITKAKLPCIHDVIYSKKSRMVDGLDGIIQEEAHTPYLPMARDLLEGREPEDVVAALLKHAFGDELVESSYREINTVTAANRGRADLVCSLGRVDGMNPKDFVDFISQAARIKPWSIQHVRVQGERTTFTVPGPEAELVVSRVLSRDGRPLVSQGDSPKKPPYRRDYPKKGAPGPGKHPFKKPYKPRKD
ncbi:MAG: DEAD/DEAH box helicase [Pseudodesulfovibrio sp.]|uniref:RNA helicase n=1 Tax=Pseudodesulfovibrio aespoeensis (strain ATCC 700646 / DSM 10631 / Aspo-2) TaxID=643562 RepID=E6VS13_PSEA9|nr:MULTISPECIES: DEAD/DEAH box helicase [Pseudodesulfovibrio]MBU4191871.1 DEAD/DEAH box helicase [Pseudomonadota bacterium]ADU61946.1 DEAD/DEAH box helicase domain protein [Pseudodesulfovibrio aespoeensis Aspo-2]MBU4245367.1 DEAD/DEAH box helicase [Pseudomonadota bacterium]MBU4380318.1 DEAD/DEAH box helicase [Pseudomonadota bacterium]MBU4476786.1 DEAD/DEAH box helicase [Pseudomonadota bacterium]